MEMLEVVGVVKFAMCKKLFNRWCPHSVRIDSGWNCTPAIGRFRCWIAMMRPSHVLAVIWRHSGNWSSETIREWYRVARKGLGKFLKRPLWVWVMEEVLPWTGSGAREMVAPNALAMHWCPRHTPRTGMVDECLERMKRALDETVIEGIKTNIALHLKIIDHPDFRGNNYSTNFLKEKLN